MRPEAPREVKCQLVHYGDLLTSWLPAFAVSFLYCSTGVLWIHLPNKLLALQFGLTFSSVQFSYSVMTNSLRPHELQHAKLPCPSPIPRVYPNSLSHGCHPTLSSSLIPFSCLQSFPASESFQTKSSLHIRWPKYWSFTFNIRPLRNTQDWSPLGWTSWISLQCKGLSRVFSNTTVQKHQFFGAQLSFLWSNSHIHAWLLEKP